MPTDRERDFWAFVTGLAVIIALWALGFALAGQGHLDATPYGSVGQVIIAGVLGLACGFYIALAIHPTAHRQAFVFLSTIFGSLVALTAIVAVANVAGSKVAIPGFDGSVLISLPTVVLLLAATLFPIAAVRSGLSSPVQLESFGRSLSFFSRRVSPTILASYGTATVAGPYGWAIGLPVGFIVLLLLVYRYGWGVDSAGLWPEVAFRGSSGPDGATHHQVPPGANRGPPGRGGA